MLEVKDEVDAAFYWWLGGWGEGELAGWWFVLPHSWPGPTLTLTLVRGGRGVILQQTGEGPVGLSITVYFCCGLYGGAFFRLVLAFSW